MPSSEDKIRVRERYEAGETCTDIAPDYGVSRHTVSNWLRSMGVEMRPPAERGGRRPGPRPGPPRRCAVTGCAREYRGRGLCEMHLSRKERTGVVGPVDAYEHATMEERHAALVSQAGPNECWPWLARKNNNGYGVFGVKVGERWQNRYAHRVAYEIRFGQLPAGVVLRHSCDNPPCCNPAHLVPGTQADNMQDMVRRGRHGFALPPATVERLHDLTADGYDYKEISEALRLPLGTVSARMSRYWREHAA